MAGPAERWGVDYHVHPDFSVDATGSIDEFCAQAVRRGLAEVCFTTHVDTFPGRSDGIVRVGKEWVPAASPEWLVEYEAAVKGASDRYADSGLVVLLGAEVDYYRGVAAALPDGFFDVDFDLVIGSVHIVDRHAISVEREARAIFASSSLERTVSTYFGLVVECVESRMFDVLGHLDIYRRYGTSHYGVAVEDAWQGHVDPVAESLRQCGVVPEVNASSVRWGLGDTMPGRALVSALVERGVTRFTVGSDAHRPEDIGSGVDRAMSVLQRHGLRPTRFRRRRPL